MGLALSPTEPNLMGVACGDNYVRLYDRRRLSLHAPATAGVHACTPWVAMFTPPHVGCAQSTSADADLETAVPDYHATHVAFSPDGSALLASFHSDHVYAFDVQTGIAESTNTASASATEDTAAVSAYVLPQLLRQLDDESAAASHMQVDAAAEVYAAVADLQSQYRAARTALDERDFTRVTTILSRALAAAHSLLLTLQQLQHSGTGSDDELWPPLDSALLAQLYCLRAEALLLRKWRGDSYLAVLDCGRAHSLCPDSHAIATQFIDALAADGRREAAKEAARSFIATHLQHSSSMQRYLSSSDSAAANSSSATTASADATAGSSAGSSSGAQPEQQAAESTAADSTAAMDTDADADNSAAAAGLIAELTDTAAAAFAEGAAAGAAAAVADAAAAVTGADTGAGAGATGRTGRRGVQVQLPSVRLTRRLSDGSHLYVRVDTVTSAPLDGTTATTVGTAAEEPDTTAADNGAADDTMDNEDANTNDDNDDMDTSDDSSDFGGDTLLTQQQRRAVQWRELLTATAASSATANSSAVPRAAASTSSRRTTAAAAAAVPPACTSALLQRYIGARNVATDIKEAAFFGANHVVAGSDDGRVFIWQRSDGQLVHAIKADEDIVNW
jgi:hypothetical protein